jgi:hypothetical protein
MIEAATWLVMILLMIAALVAIKRRGRGRVGPAAAGAIYDLLQEDKRKAIEIIVEERAEARDPEDADGNLPELEGKPR